MKKLALAATSLVLSLSLALTGCGGSAQNAAKQDNGAAKSADSGKKQDTLIVARGGDAAALDPAIVTDGESLKVTHQIFDTLLEYKDGTTEVQPGLADSWEISKDGLKYTFKLHKDVKFHDGTDFNADAVVFNFKRWSDPKSQYKFEGDSFDYYDSMFGPDGSRVIKDVKAVDPLTVEFTLNKRQAPFLQNIAMPAFGIASPKAIQDEKAKFKEQPVGTGPFIFKEWKRNDSVSLEKNPNYWKPGLPKVSKLIIRTIPDNSARFTALQSGEVDLMEGVNPDDLKQLEANKDLQKMVRPSFNVGYVGFNFKKKPFDNPKVRMALNYAVDKKALIQAFYAGLAEPAKNPMPPTLWGYNDQIQDYPYDLEKAKQLLKEAGYPNGIQQTITFYAMPVARPYMPDGKKVAEALQANFAKIGVKTNIVSPEWATYLDETKKGEKDDMFMLGWTGDNGDPDNFIYALLDKDSIPGNNRDFYINEDLHKILLAAQAEPDQAKRADMYKKAQEIIKKDCPWIPLVHSTPLLAAKANLKGYIPSPTGSEPYSTTYLQ
jgi:peptide/nickel transport system substrate-binding protein